MKKRVEIIERFVAIIDLPDGSVVDHLYITVPLDCISVALQEKEAMPIEIASEFISHETDAILTVSHKE